MFKVEIISGKDLKSLRQSMGIGLGDVHRVTKISPTVLKAIENDDIAHLPAMIYLKSFLRSYAEILQLDTNTIVDGYLKNIGKG
jgi:cytoskeleton protein RodZ